MLLMAPKRTVASQLISAFDPKSPSSLDSL